MFAFRWSKERNWLNVFGDIKKNVIEIYLMAGNKYMHGKILTV